MSERPEFAGLTDRVENVLFHGSALLRKEARLARLEMSQNLNRAVVALGLLVAAALAALVALNLLAGAAVGGLVSLGIPAPWAAVLVGGGLATLALAATVRALRDLRPSALAPTRTVQNLHRDFEALKEAM